MSKLVPDYQRYVTIGQLCEMLGISRAGYYRHLNDPGFPQPFSLGGHQRLVYDDVLRYLGQQQATREPTLPPRKKRSGRPPAAPSAYVR